MHVECKTKMTENHVLLHQFLYMDLQESNKIPTIFQDIPFQVPFTSIVNYAPVGAKDLKVCPLTG